MKIFNKTYWIIALLLMLSASVFAQSTRKTIKKGNEAFENLQYINAIDIYTRIVDSGVEDEKLIQRLAEASYFNRDFKAAAKWYKRYYKLPSVHPGVLDNYYYGQVLKTQKEYQLADSLLLTYYNYKGIRYNSLTDPTNGVTNIDNRNVFEFLDYDHNTKRSEYPAFIKDKQLYVVGYDLDNKKKKHTPDLTSDIYEESADGQFLPLSEYVNSEYNEGPLAITNDGKTMYFSRNAYLKGRVERNKSNVVTINIYSAQFKNGKWKDVKEFPFNSDDYSVAHPALSKDNKTLYYVSDEPGGKGGTDIYAVPIKNDGTFGQPKNLEAINTSGNEMFPFIDPYDESLYFASDGPESMGGLDIFISKKDLNNQYKRSYNLGEKINSTYDDFSFVVGADRKGYFASNRHYDKGMDDIYAFKLLKNFEVPAFIDFKGIAKDYDSNLPLTDVKLSLYSSNDQLIASTTTDDKGNYEFAEVNANKVVYVKAEKDNYQPSEKNLTKAMRIGKEPLGIRLVNRGKIVPEKIMITGKIQDNNTQKLIANTSVTALDINGKILGTTQTKWYGYYSLNNVSSDKIAFLIIEKDSYQTEQVPVNLKDVDAHGKLKIDLNMAKSTVPIELNNDISAILNPIHFDFAKSEIRPDAKIELDKVVEVLKKFKSLNIRIESYTDSQGSYLTNIELSHARARATYDYLVDKGISPKRLEYRGFGEYHILNRCTNGVPCTDQENQVNRRSVFRIIKI